MAWPSQTVPRSGLLKWSERRNIPGYTLTQLARIFSFILYAANYTITRNYRDSSCDSCVQADFVLSFAVKEKKEVCVIPT